MTGDAFAGQWSWGAGESIVWEGHDAAVALKAGPARLTLSAQGWSKSPNVVLITIDTVRADRVRCYGYRRARTPNLDALAREGALFKTVVASVPLTLPSHCSILTGTYPTLHRVRDNLGYKL